MKVTVTRSGLMSFEARSPSGASLRMDGPPELGGTDQGMRPMETLLASLAGCSAVDVVKILGQQREPLEGLEIQVEGKRADAIPAVFTDIHLRFIVRGPVAENKARRAVALSAEKYCSVSKMLEPSVRITHEVVLEPGAGGAPESLRASAHPVEQTRARQHVRYRRLHRPSIGLPPPP